MFVPVTMSMGDGITIYNRELEGFESRAENLTVPLTEIGVSFIKGIGEQFATEGAYAYDWPYPGAGPWKRLTDKYHAWKEEHYPGRPILVATGTMRRAVLAGGGHMLISPHHLFYTPSDAYVTRQYKHRREGGHLIVDPHSRTVNMAHVAWYHQIGAGNNPNRPMVAFPLSELREWDRTLIAWLHGREPLSTRLG